MYDRDKRRDNSGDTGKARACGFADTIACGLRDTAFMGLLRGYYWAMGSLSVELWCGDWVEGNGGMGFDGFITN